MSRFGMNINEYSFISRLSFEDHSKISFFIQDINRFA